MVRMLPPKYSFLAPDLIKNYAPPENKIYVWHIVRNGHVDGFESIAKRYSVPLGRLIEFNFPGSVNAGRVDPAIVNWYLFNHVRTRCRIATRDKHNYVFKGGERIAVPYLGQVDAGLPVILAPTNTKFKIKQHANLNVSAEIAADFSIFQIWDEKASLCSFYTYWAGGVTGSLTPGFLSATLAGDWNEMTVTKPLPVNRFTGSTTFSTAGAWSKTLNYICFLGLPPGVETIPNPLRIETGITLGAGSGTSTGYMKLELLGTLDGLLPYKGS